MRVALISGTWGAKWAQEGTAFRAMLQSAGIYPVLPPFEWSEDVSGIPSFFTGGKHSDWKAGGFALGLYLRTIPFDDRILIAHSHGGHVVAYSLLSSFAVPIRRLITVGTPFRDDMSPIWQQAKDRIGFHIHICDPKPPNIEHLAQLFDGRWGWAKSGHPTADVTVKIPKMKHSKILDDPAWVERWREKEGLLGFVTAEEIEGERSVV